MNDEILEFIVESNRIEGIHRAPTWDEIAATEKFLRLSRIEIDDLAALVGAYEPGAVLRGAPGLNVRIGGRRAPDGGPKILTMLGELLRIVNKSLTTPYEAHRVYEYLHPFTDGNGRSGRTLWLWMMDGVSSRGFLHEFYYQTLENFRQ